MLTRLLFGWFVSISACAAEKEDGFVELFDGKTLEGWDGDPVYWSVKDGMVVGEVTPETLLKQNSFLIWRGGTTGFWGFLLWEKSFPRHGWHCSSRLLVRC